jgi:hypothetical protein
MQLLKLASAVAADVVEQHRHPAAAVVRGTVDRVLGRLHGDWPL